MEKRITWKLVSILMILVMLSGSAGLKPAQAQGAAPEVQTIPASEYFWVTYNICTDEEMTFFGNIKRTIMLENDQWIVRDKTDGVYAIGQDSGLLYNIMISKFEHNFHLNGNDMTHIKIVAQGKAENFTIIDHTQIMFNANGVEVASGFRFDMYCQYEGK